MGKLRENIGRESRVYRVKLLLTGPVLKSRDDLQSDVQLTIDQVLFMASMVEILWCKPRDAVTDASFRVYPATFR